MPFISHYGESVRIKNEWHSMQSLCVAFFDLFLKWIMEILLILLWPQTYSFVPNCCFQCHKMESWKKNLPHYGKFTKWKRKLYAKKVKSNTFQVHPGRKMHHATCWLCKKTCFLFWEHIKHIKNHVSLFCQLIWIQFHFFLIGRKEKNLKKHRHGAFFPVEKLRMLWTQTVQFFRCSCCSFLVPLSRQHDELCQTFVIHVNGWE